MGWSSGFNLKYFKKGEKLTKKYIIQKMMGNEKYGDYVPDRTSPHSLSRDFLLSVRLLHLIDIVGCLYRSNIISKFSKYRKGSALTGKLF